MMGGPIIVHVDDVHEQEVVRVEYDDGRHTSIHERFLLDTPRMFSFWNRWDPGMISLKHGHQGDHIVFVLDGEVMVGGVQCRKGSHIFLMHGDRFGPWIAGPEGCELLGIIAGDGSAFWSDQDMADYQAMLTEAGARMAAVPPLAERPPFRAKGNPLPSRVLDN
ncbi:hypothetical protein [Sphingobium baderi]|uniref:Cupin 2 conserved barrel domain-containing protein n=1 Tax=Sphingobium baderi LL03 TaxID=1114964 RepID=T0HLI3_9SPHN|nr:hypothetical protein [Sphingobium baderi]EQA98428.1 hypothetical protein L485_17250 [Sphingobium baderi LL03]KMS61285.1 hypothetical protein V475_13200 [Sphingobium baderi LL03]